MRAILRALSLAMLPLASLCNNARAWSDPGHKIIAKLRLGWRTRTREPQLDRRDDLLPVHRRHRDQGSFLIGRRGGSTPAENQVLGSSRSAR